MKAWRLEGLGGRLALEEIPVPEPRRGSVLVRIKATSLLTYIKAYVEGQLPFYKPPPGPFTIGTKAVGTIEAIGRGVWRLKPGQRVVISPHVAARENVDDPAQILIGLTSAPESAPMLADWPDGTLADYALVPVEAATPLDGLEGFESTELAALSRFIVPFGGLARGRLAPGETLVVNGATGAFGTAAVLRGVAMGRRALLRPGATPRRSARSRKPQAGASRPSRSRATSRPTRRRSGKPRMAGPQSPSTWSAARPTRVRRWRL
jgi:alcohol dehydrogenase